MLVRNRHTGRDPAPLWLRLTRRLPPRCQDAVAWLLWLWRATVLGRDERCVHVRCAESVTAENALRPGQRTAALRLTIYDGFGRVLVLTLPAGDCECVAALGAACRAMVEAVERGRAAAGN